jgi:putative ABC transport system substrate-binding protein
MRRRDFIAGLGGVAALPFPANAQRRPVIGYMAIQSRESSESVAAAFRRGLSEGGFEDGRNVSIEYRFGDNQVARMPQIAEDLVSRKVDVIVAMGGSASSLAAKAAARGNLPVVFTTGDADPVTIGLVNSLARPETNVTGFSFLGGMLGAKRVEILRELVPGAATIGVLVNPKNHDSLSDTRDLQSAVLAGQQQLVAIEAGPADDLATALADLKERRVDALIVAADPTFTVRRTELAVLTARHGIPAIYQWNLFVRAGGLISYGAELDDGYRQTGLYTARVLKGEKPNDLPVLQPTKFMLSINLKTAKALGLGVPPTLLARADEVIE